MPINGCFKNPRDLTALYNYFDRIIRCEELNIDEAKKEAYFYVRSKADGDLKTFRLNSNYRPEPANFDGLRFDKYQNTEDGYCVWKVTVDLLHFKTSILYIGTDKDGADAREIQIINDMRFLPKFAWIHADSINVDADGYIVDSESDLINKAHNTIDLDSKSAAMYGYFGVLQEDNRYKAVRSGRLTGTGNLKIWETEKDSYQCLLEWNRFGEYTVTADYEGSVYKMKLKVSVPDYGCSLSREVNEDSFFEENFSYNCAEESSEDGTEKYFYLFTLAKNCSTSDVKVLIGKPNDMRVYQGGEDVEIDGLAVESAEKIDCGGKSYFSCKITVRNNFKRDSAICIGMRCGEGDNAEEWYTETFNIYDSSYYFGDADGNKKTDMADVLYLKRFLAGWEKYQNPARNMNVTRPDETEADEDALMEDLMILERHVAGWKDYKMLPYSDIFIAF